MPLLNEYMEKERQKVLDKLHPELIGHDYYGQVYYHPQVNSPDIQGKWCEGHMHLYEIHVANGLVHGWITRGSLNKECRYVPSLQIYINGHKLNWFEEEDTPENREKAKRVIIEQLKLQARAILLDLEDKEGNWLDQWKLKC
jgi:hypothetical protein